MELGLIINQIDSEIACYMLRFGLFCLEGSIVTRL